MRRLTINRLALRQVGVILAGQESIAIASDDTFNVAIVDIEEKTLHLWWMDAEALDSLIAAST
jgi:hypothetical protein